MEDENKNSDFSDIAGILEGKGFETKQKANKDENVNPDISDDINRDDVVLPGSKVALIKKLVNNIRESSEKINSLLAGSEVDEEEIRIGLRQAGEILLGDDEGETEGTKITEGVFDGENMIGPDGKQYSVPANYASKSKLVEGDIMKLTISPKGTFVFKQIGPIERKRVVGKLIKEADGSCYVVGDGGKWRILTASATYYKGEDGDEVVILVPKSGDSKWGAVENIVRG